MINIVLKHKNTSILNVNFDISSICMTITIVMETLQIYSNIKDPSYVWKWKSIKKFFVYFLSPWNTTVSLKLICSLRQIKMGWSFYLWNIDLCKLHEVYKECYTRIADEIYSLQDRGLNLWKNPSFVNPRGSELASVRIPQSVFLIFLGIIFGKHCQKYPRFTVAWDIEDSRMTIFYLFHNLIGNFDRSKLT